MPIHYESSFKLELGIFQVFYATPTGKVSFFPDKNYKKSVKNYSRVYKSNEADIFE